MVKLAILCGAALMSGAVAALVGDSRAQPAPSSVPVVVELFTSEGCSDCPPADSLLAKLAAQPVAGVQLIPLEEHVDYWDRQGWRDPFSDASFTRRQVDYTGALHVESPYTPQMIVNGRDEFVGSNGAAAATAIARAARDAGRQLRVSLAIDPVAGASVIPLRITTTAPDGVTVRGGDVMVAVTEDELSSHVTAGENRGKTLRHTAVVRSLVRVGETGAKPAAWSGGGEVVLDRTWKRQALHVVAFVQDHGSRAILGAATAALH